LKLEQHCTINSPVSIEKIPLLLSKSKMGIVALVMNETLSHVTPTKTFEYLSCNLPIFSYGPSTAMEKILDESQAGTFVRGNEPDKIAEKLITVLSDKSLLEKYSRNGRKYVERRTDSSNLIKWI